jgi:hypothetical protein
MCSASCPSRPLWTWPTSALMATTCRHSCMTPTRGIRVIMARGACLASANHRPGRQPGMRRPEPSLPAPYPGFNAAGGATSLRPCVPFPQYGTVYGGFSDHGRSLRRLHLQRPSGSGNQANQQRADRVGQLQLGQRTSPMPTRSIRARPAGKGTAVPAR